ncbi:carbohydrate-binding module family 5 protein [Hypholoma sublateritium FD-334 SS-4]|uniref:chitinase n=1 Tax=Hypholoma sublateritium (strain FD-334 SS-4) TaxID=945553 RepID=A0A0D2PBP4_HYPSF|nr:carbohydrate-binding module family 5 protein [Hypholoma sublateritium FD-334 SS-4]
MFFFAALLIGILSQGASAFDNTRFDNSLFRYWGQNSYGATNTANTADWQQRLSFYCNDDAVDVFPLAFMNVFFGTGGLPSLNLANTCNPTDNATFPGTTLPNCSSLASDITACQAKGKIITMSLGGATGAVGFTSASQATTFAQTIWNLLLGGTSSTRPFGTAVLDGIDLDIEGGGSQFYDSFVNEIRSLSAGASKKYYVTAAPQCVFPDANLGSVLNAANFDAIYGVFYNNFCGLQSFGQANNWNFGIWDEWARTTSPNPNTKVYIGAPASTSAAGSGYVSISTLSSIAVQMRKSFPSFGGVMLWDESQAYANNRYDLAIKNALSAAGGTGFTFPACSAPAWSSGTTYAGGANVSFGGYAKWSASSQPAGNANSDWSAISACGGAALPSSSSTSTPKPTSTSSTSSASTTVKSTSTQSTTSSTTAKTTTASTTIPTPTSGGNCGGVAAWSSAVAYVGGSQVVYNSHLWTANWWSEADVPGGVSGDWADNGPCTTQQAAKTVADTQDTATPTQANNATIPSRRSRAFRF